MTRSWSLVIAIALSLHAGLAQANGRFPQTVNVYVQPGNDQVVLLAATFGLLISRDGGVSFSWVCEEAVGYGGMYDPDYALTTDGTIYATTWEGLRVSRDGGCTWTNVPALAGQWAEEVEVSPQNDIWVATATSDMPNDVYLSTDQGQTFESRNLKRDGVFWKALQVAPSNPQRLYVSGYKVADVLADGGLSGPVAYLYRTDDGGTTWTELSLGGVVLGQKAWFFVLGVAPDNPDVVFAASIGANAPVGDALYRSSDAGQTWTRVLDSTDAIAAFVIRQNGDIIAGTDEDGVHISSDGGDTWTRTGLPQMKCLAETGAGVLLSCGANWEPDFFALGRSTDGREWTEVFRFSEVRDAYECPRGTVQFDTCEALRWPALCEMFACNRVDAGPTPVDAAVDGGTGKGNGGGCCDASAPGAVDGLVLGAAVWLLLLAGRRRASRRSVAE